MTLPWLRQQAAEAWRQKLPTVVLVPTRAHGFYLHSRVVEAGFNLAAIHFWTPQDVRINFSKYIPGLKPVLSRESMNALAALAAQEVGRKDPMNRTAVAVLSEPDSFLRTVEQLAEAGWDLAEMNDVADTPLRTVVREWKAWVKRFGFQTAPELDRELISHVSAGTPHLAKILITGFDGSRWAEWPLLQAVVDAAQHADAVLIAPRLGWEEIDQAWIGTWEERFGAAQPVPASDAAERTKPYVLLQETLHSHGDKVSSKCGSVTFRLGANIREEAAAIVAETLGFLQQTECTRLGIVFPSAGTLSREVAAQLDVAGICCNDGFGFAQPGSFEREDWRAWVDFQKAPDVSRLLALLEFTEPKVVAGETQKISREIIRVALRGAFKEVLIDDLDVLRERLTQSRSTRDVAVAKWMVSMNRLPDRATWRDFVAKVVTELEHLEWQDRARWIELSAREAEFLNDVETPRAVFLRWLEEKAVSTQQARAAQANHRYARVQLINYAEAEKQQWSHLILTSLSEGVWPPGGNDFGFLSGSEVLRLNRSIRRLNKASVHEGGQGEGHDSVEMGRGLCVGPFERRLLAESQLLGILENVESGLVLTSRLGEEKAAGRRLAPSEFFSRSYGLCRKKILDDAEMERLREESSDAAREISAKVEGLAASHILLPEKTNQCLIAFNARRASEKTFGEYEFSLREPVMPLRTLSCGDWELALKTPALVWMQKYIGVAPEEEITAESLFLSVRGTWAHRWLAALGAPRSNRFVPWPNRADLPRKLDSYAQSQRDEVDSLLRQNGRVLPVWWQSLWEEARFLSRELLVALEPALEWPRFSTEYILPKTDCDFSEGKLPLLKLGGRIDLLLGWNALEDEVQLPSELWLIDFKTGASSRPLSWGELKKGNGVQLALYALALMQIGALKVQASLLKPGELLREQMGREHFDEMREGWLELQRMQASGCFGAHGELRSEYRRTKEYPLATLPIDPEILEEKWTRSHPAWSESV